MHALKLLCYNSNISDITWAMTLKLGMTVDLWTAYMLILVSMNLTLLQGHSGSADEKNQRWIISATNQVSLISIERARPFFIFFFFLLHGLDLENMYIYVYDLAVLFKFRLVVWFQCKLLSYAFTRRVLRLMRSRAWASRLSSLGDFFR